MKEFFYEPSECPLPNKGTINEMYIVFNFLRMLPTFATAYTFCASRDGVFFAWFINMREKKILASVIEIRKENWG